MLPRRLEVRFALEALFLVLLALGAGLAGLRPLYIVAVMAAAWLLVALAELTAERIARSPLSYLLPLPEDEPQQVFGPRPEERTVVAPPSSATESQPESLESAGTEERPPRAPEPIPEPDQAPEPEHLPEPKPVEPLEPSLASRVRARLRRREPDVEPAPASQPRHVKLLPRRSAPEPSRAAQEVAELFGARSEPADEETRTEDAEK